MLRPFKICGWVSVQCVLLHCLIHLSVSELSVFYYVGDQAMLPCNWTSCVGAVRSSSSPYLWWETPMESVFELQGGLCFEGPDYKGRVEVKPRSFEEGDCSLLLREVRFSDAGPYESFISVGKRRRFIRSVELNVRDHKSKETVVEGQQLKLKLHTTQAATVVFQRNREAGANVIWQRGGGGSRQGHLTEGERELILSAVTLEDSGTYRVLDPDGLAVSTVHLTVEEALNKLPVPEGRKDGAYNEDARDVQSSAIRTSGTSLIMSSLLFIIYHIHFLSGFSRT
ncbi:galectin 17 isoform X2 [Anguilla rostrata]|uniref:galectin 17 isoform X2 n=1 Tax=Anguilla rostrata TaxID=7938 RepID=UPI0030CD3847